MKPVHQQTILITGAKDGIGKLTALSLARQQAEVLIHGRSKDKVGRVVAELKEASANPKIVRVHQICIRFEQRRRSPETSPYGFARLFST